MSAPNSNTLLLTTHRDDFVQGKINDGLEDILGTAVDAAQFDEIEFLVGDRVELYWRGIELGQYKKIIMYGGVSRLLRITHPLAVALLHRKLNVYTSGAENFRGLDKLSQNVLFSVNDIPIPRTYFAAPEVMIARAVEVIGFPLILKDILASQGERNYLIHNQEELVARLEEMQENRFIIQEYIENEGDMRVLINNKGSTFAFFRRAKEGSHLNNTSAGGSAEPLENLPIAVVEGCKRVLEAMRMPQLGLDVIVSDQKHWFLEANTQPQIFTGAYVHDKTEFFQDSIHQ